MPKKPKSGSNVSHVKDQKPDERVVNNDLTGTQQEKKYNRRAVQSNWEKYETDMPNDVKEGESTSDAHDFSALVKNANLSSHSFRFKSEQNWEKEIAEKKPFQLNLNLQVLSAGLACIPFHERIGLDKNIFSEEDLKKCDAFADGSKKKYENVKNTYFKPDENLEALSRHYESVVIRNKEDNELIHQKFLAQFSKRNHLQRVQDLPVIKFECEKESEINVVDSEEIDKLILNVEKNNDLSEINDKLENIDIDTINIKKTVDKVPAVKQNAQLTANSNDEENLEDWLDSVLDG